MLAPLAAQEYQRVISAGREKFRFRFLAAPATISEAISSGQIANRSVYVKTIVGPGIATMLELLVDNLPTAQFASEGQQRTIALALKIAQAEALKTSRRGESAIAFD